MPPPAAQDRPPAALALLSGAVFAAAGAAWILASFETAPGRGLHYHVPLAFVFGVWIVPAVDAAARRGRPRALLLTAGALGLALLRIVHVSPFSGHAVLGALIAVLGPWPLLRVAGAALVVQAIVTKVLLGEDPWSAPLGAAAGLALARWPRRRACARRLDATEAPAPPDRQGEDGEPQPSAANGRSRTG